MSDEEKDINDILDDSVLQPDSSEEGTSTPKTTHTDSGDTKLHLSGMYRNWFLEYASYVILERAVPHLADGLKPVQRRILHAMKQLEDGRYNKVANVIGSTMAYHPHGDAAIGDALVRKTCLSTTKVTGVTYSRAIARLLRVTSRLVCRSLPLRWCTAPRLPSGNSRTTVARKSPSPCPSSFPYCWHKVSRVLP